MTVISLACCRAGIDPNQLTNNEPGSSGIIGGVKIPKNEKNVKIGDLAGWKGIPPISIAYA